TFCIEDNEFVYPDTLYNQTINPEAIGGGDGGPHPDPVSQGTGWLYSQFAAGTLPGYAYGVGRLASADLLQKAIWFLEEESGGAGETTRDNGSCQLLRPRSAPWPLPNSMVAIHTASPR